MSTTVDFDGKIEPSGEHVGVPTIDVLDHGFISLVNSLGDDLTIVNSARVSYGVHKKELDERDYKLLRFLAQNKHYSPFRHVQLQFHIKMPEFVARQWYKHIVGISCTTTHPTVDHAWNEISQRYLNATEHFQVHLPTSFRLQSQTNKQGSTEEIVPEGTNYRFRHLLRQHYKAAFDLYDDMIKAGIAKEQAREVLPLSIYTEFYWTASLQAIANLIVLRDDSHAQLEIQLYAQALKRLTEVVCPVGLSQLLEAMKGDTTHGA